MNPSLESGEFYSDQTFSGLAAGAQQVEGSEFQDCVFKDCRMREAQFTGCSFKDCRFIACDLSLARVLHSRFSGCQFTDCQLLGINWSEADLPRTRLQKPFDFMRCGLNHATFIQLDLKGIRMQDCSAHNVDFSDADLSRAALCGTDFENSRFVHTDLSAADLRGASSYSISPLLNTLKQAHFSLPEALSLLYNLDILLDE